MTELSPKFATDPPRFRKAPGNPAESLDSGRCERCEAFSDIGYCAKYQTPVEKDNLCNGYVSILKDGKRQWAEP